MVMVSSPTNGVVVLLEENMEQSKPTPICFSNQFPGEAVLSGGVSGGESRKQRVVFQGFWTKYGLPPCLVFPKRDSR